MQNRLICTRDNPFWTAYPKSWTEPTQGMGGGLRPPLCPLSEIWSRGVEWRARLSFLKCGNDTKKRGRRDVSLVYGIPENRD